VIVSIDVDLPDQTVERFAAAGVDLQEYAGRFLAKSLLAFAPAAPEQSSSAATLPVDPENAAAVALLQSWLVEDASDEPEAVRAAEAELAELKQSLNANRAEGSERLLFP